MAYGEDAERRLVAMTEALAHRGPDGRAHWLGPGVGLGHTRLAVIDLAGGTQPMWSDCGQHVVVFNGEIYNHDGLRADLAKAGYRFRTRSDTEVIWAAIDAWGIERALAALRGMFAFALYDARRRTLLLGRDRVGIKPLFLARVARGVAFASEPKALLVLPQVTRRVNPTGIHDYLTTGYATAPATCFRDIQTIEPGCWLELGPQGERSGRYWTWEPRGDGETSIDVATDRVEATLRDAVKTHRLADVPVGALLSGGLDSSLITAMAGDRDRMQTFSVGFGDPEYDESPFARQVAQHFDTDHHEIQFAQGEGDPDLFQRIVEQFDEPFGDSSAIPLYVICREARRTLKVVLSGDGGDEVLGGYGRYRWLQQFAPVERGPLSPLRFLASVARQPGGSFGRRLAMAWQFKRMTSAERICQLQSIFREGQRHAMYQPEFARLVAGQGSSAERLSPYVPQTTRDPIQQMIAAELTLRLQADYLRKVDVASSAHGLEVRVPYLDVAMLDVAADLPVAFKYAPSGETKVLSRRLACKYLPEGFDVRRKQGFSIPIDFWAGPKLRRFFQDLLLDPGARTRAFVRPTSIEQVWHAFVDNDAASSASRYGRYQRLFLLVSLELWLRNWAPSVS